MDEVRIQFEKIKKTEKPILGTPEANEYYDNVIKELNDPQLNKLSKIRYEVPGNYTNPKCFLRFIAKFAKEKINKEKYADDEINLLTSLVVHDLLEHDVPFYKVEKDILTALINTDPPDEAWILKENPLPFPATGFIFPHDVLILDETKNVSIDWCVLGSYKFPEGHSRLIALSNDRTNHCFLLSSLHEKHALSKTIPVYNEKENAERVLTNIENVDNVMKLLYNIITLMNSCPEYTDNSVSKREVKPKRQGDPVKIFSSVKTIGKNFRLITKSQVKDSTGRVMPIHWRRGHWRHIVKGSRSIPLEERRKNPELFIRKLFPPVLVNA
jgi:hypothetical protein